jgi:hypothetical protein
MEPQSNSDEILRLRKRVTDLLNLGYMTPESAGTYEQTLLQIHQESERRKQQLMHQAATLRRQADAAEAQGHAFSAMASILYSIVNGFYEAGRKRLQEDEAREVDKAQRAMEEAEEAKAVQVVVEVPPPKKTGRPKKS